jgi:diguanylate cyclase (GGDEF)-like protein
VLIARTRDITEQRRAEEQIHRLAYRDALTGLPNRAATLEWLDHLLTQAPTAPLLLINLDLDDFRAVNQAFGQAAGDALLQAVAQTFQARLPAGAWFARLGSDDFLLVLSLPMEWSELKRPVEAGRWVSRLQDWLNSSVEAMAFTLPRVTLSAGLVLHPWQQGSAQQLLACCEAALQQAKPLGAAAYQIYSQEISQRIQRRKELELELAGAIDAQRFELVYQPKWNRQQQLVGAEALLRFRRANGAMVSPEEFIPLAERSGQIHQIGAWVLEAVASQIAAWRAQGLMPPPIAVNVSARQLEEAPGVVPLLAQLQDLAGRYDLAPEQLLLEITETALLGDDPTIGLLLHQLVVRGYRLAIDDFGAGYSSLAVVRDYPIHELKIDQSYVQQLSGNHSCRSIVAAMVALSRGQGIGLVAEGVETEEQRLLLEELGVEQFQGYLLDQPLSADVFAERLRQPPA